MVHDDLESAGQFTCSNPLLNRIYQNIVWGVSGNYRSIPTDCPQRDERQGWLGDRSAESRGRDVSVQHGRIVRQVAPGHGRRPEAHRQRLGRLPCLLADLLRQRHLAQQHGDHPRRIARPVRRWRIIASHYESAKKWMDYMGSFVTNGIITRDSYGDWCVPPEDPKLIHSNDPSARRTRHCWPRPTSTMTPRSWPATRRCWASLTTRSISRALAEKLKAAFNQKFFHADTGPV